MIPNPTFADGTPVPDDYLARLADLIDAAIDYEERYGSEEERIARPEDWRGTHG